MLVLKVEYIRFTCSFIFSVLIFTIVLHQCSSKPGSFQFSEKETTALEKFRELVQDALYADYMSTDGYLIRWIRDQDFDLGAANEKLRKCIEWRKRTGVDTVFDDPMIQELNKTYPIQFSGYGRSGSPVFTTSFGMWKLRRLTLGGMAAAANRHLQSILELGEIHVTKLQREGRNVTQMIFLTDLMGFSLKENVCLPCLPMYTDIALTLDNYYPGIIEVVVAINGPKIFENVLILFPPKARKLLKVYGFNRKDWQEAIQKIVSPEQLTTQYGGNRTKDA